MLYSQQTLWFRKVRGIGDNSKTYSLLTNYRYYVKENYLLNSESGTYCDM